MQSRQATSRYYGLLQLHQRLTYRDVDPRSWRDWATRLARDSPTWAPNLENRGTDDIV